MISFVELDFVALLGPVPMRASAILGHLVNVGLPRGYVKSSLLGVPVMDVRKEVQKVWQSRGKRERRVVHSFSKGSPDADLRIRCMVVLNLVRGECPTCVATVLNCSRSHVYRIASRWIGEGLAGLIDRREDNGEDKATEDYQAVLLVVLEGTPRNHGYRRPTWTQELLTIVLEKKTGIKISTTTMGRVLRRLNIRRRRPKAVVGCPWSKGRKTRRLNEIRRLIETLPSNEVVVYVDEVDIHLNPKIGPDWKLPGVRDKVWTPGKNQKRYLAGALNAKTGKLTWVESDGKNSDLFIDQLWTTIQKRSESTSSSTTTASIAVNALLSLSMPSRTRSAFISFRRIARVTIESSACGKTSTTT
jgi:transposase